ncbi:aldehyde dehydrogenase family 2 member B4, mitochondrial-like [Selaginella moellendorffii]|uniref:aldehyde dehydrogenase family 2 member B4, mitochondrial-like n=1 Tax=Selaginella moellendorffii TaxID=88036 RepID=UPI000D1C4DA6|nr:aldehyde dehydrogenase family 2 member B4, mitochondrial-like [Selaginella moellendorffii]|eukprot:XP_024531104.1 aldehyde dehydrogenase family 2 member B4, mitochondrial-like [Selaginella moellendorffii]
MLRGPTGRYQETRSLDQFVTKFRTVQEATERTNNTKYVLAEVCGAFTKDIDTANWDPCGSSPKMSGQGREKGEYVLHNYTQVKAVVTALRNPA